MQHLESKGVLSLSSSFCILCLSCCSWHCSWRPASGFWWWGGRGELGTGGRSWDQWGLDYHQGVHYLQGDHLDYHQVSTLHLDYLDKLDTLASIWQTHTWQIYDKLIFDIYDKPQWTQLRNSTLHSDWLTSRCPSWTPSMCPIPVLKGAHLDYLYGAHLPCLMDAHFD